MTGRTIRYQALLDRARAAVADRGDPDPRETLRRALSRDPKYLIDRLSERKPRFVVWELTRACNMRCRHCGSSAGRPLADELTPEEALELADELSELGCERVTLLGGEPLLRPDWPQIASRLRAGSVRVNMISNGWLTGDEDVLHAVEEAGLVNVGISVDGLEETHDRLRRRPGSFRRCFDAMAALAGRGIKPAAVTVVTGRNLDELPRLHELLRDTGIKLWQVQIAVPRGRLQRESKNVLSPAGLLRLARMLIALREQGDLRIDVSDNIGYFGGFEEALRPTAEDQLPFWTGCYAGVRILGIDPNGDIKGCASLPSVPEFIEGNVRKRSLREIWESPDAFAYNRRFALDQLASPCRECEHAPICRGGCKSAALGFTGSLASTCMCLNQQ